VDPSGAQSVSAPIALRVHPLGDFDLDAALGGGDLAMLHKAMEKGNPDPQFDLTHDDVLDRDDIDFWLQLQPGLVSADFDGNEFVDGHDFLMWQRGYGKHKPNAVRQDGDADVDQDVDAVDLAVLELQFGTSVESPSAVAMDLPATPPAVVSSMWPQEFSSVERVRATVAASLAARPESNDSPASRSGVDMGQGSTPKATLTRFDPFWLVSTASYSSDSSTSIAPKLARMEVWKLRIETVDEALERTFR
jgi:hypothetical protein